MPINYIMLGIFTLFESVSVGSLTARFDVISVLVSIGVFCLITGCLWIAALFTKLSERLMTNFCVAIILAVVLQLTSMTVLFYWGFGDG